MLNQLSSMIVVTIIDRKDKSDITIVKTAAIWTHDIKSIEATSSETIINLSAEAAIELTTPIIVLETITTILSKINYNNLITKESNNKTL